MTERITLRLRHERGDEPIGTEKTVAGGVPRKGDRVHHDMVWWEVRRVDWLFVHPGSVSADRGEWEPIVRVIVRAAEDGR